MNKRILLPAFVLVALVQLYVPAKMIWNQEDVLAAGVEYKFRTAPVDPTDPFRGKYIILGFEDNTVRVENEKDWTVGEQIYVDFTTDAAGFATILSATKERPTEVSDFLEVPVRSVSSNGSNTLRVDYPFDRYYMKETKAYEAEQLYRKLQRTDDKTAYALVSINNGAAVLQDVQVDGVSIKDLVSGGH